ncbi:MAG: hypothetical protein ACI8ZN_001981 [Bacteroidia bacterium]|jgi:hypothetical protein
MSTNQEQISTTNPEPRSININVPNGTLKGNRKIVPIGYLLVLISFFFSFMNINCGGTKLASVSGIDLVIGDEIEKKDIAAVSFDTTDFEVQTIKPNPFAIIAFGCSVLGLLLFFFKQAKESRNNMILSTIGFVSLVIIPFASNSFLTEKTSLDSAFEVISISFQLGYFIALGLFLVIAIISYVGREKVASSNPNLPQGIVEEDGQRTYRMSSPSDPIDWMMHHPKLIGGIVLCLAAAGIYYYINYAPNADRDGERAAEYICNCDEKLATQSDEYFHEMESKIKSGELSSGTEAMKLLKKKNYQLAKKHRKCRGAALKKRELLITEYRTSEGDNHRFIEAFDAKLKSCPDTTERNERNEFFAGLKTLIKTLPNPAPDATRIREDILGKNMAGWKLRLDEEIVELKSDTGSFIELKDGTPSVKIKLTTKLKGIKSEDYFVTHGVIVYTLSEDDWEIEDYQNDSIHAFYAVDNENWKDIYIYGFYDFSTITLLTKEPLIWRIRGFEEKTGSSDYGKSMPLNFRYSVQAAKSDSTFVHLKFTFLPADENEYDEDYEYGGHQLKAAEIEEPEMEEVETNSHGY